MRRIIHICLWLLTGIFAEASLSAQNPFIYHKGKTYKEVASYRMEEIIDLNTHFIRTTSAGTPKHSFV